MISVTVCMTYRNLYKVNITDLIAFSHSAQTEHCMLWGSLSAERQVWADILVVSVTASGILCGPPPPPPPSQ